MRHPTVLVLAGLALCAGCNGYDFSGQQSQIGFDSGLTRPYLEYRPDMNIAQGSTVSFDAVKVLDTHLKITDPKATPILSDPSLFESVTSDVDHFTGTGAMAGDADLGWLGAVSDTFTLHVRAVASGRLTDPVLMRLRLYDLLKEIKGAVWDDVGDTLALERGEKLFLDVELDDDAGEQLAFGPGLVEVTTTGAVKASVLGQGVMLEMPPGAPNDAGTVEISIGGAPLQTITMRAASTSDVTDLVLSHHQSDGDQVIKATAKLADGSTLWQAPVKWTYDPRFVKKDLGKELGVDPSREDIVWLTWPSTQTGDFDTTIEATVGSASASLPAHVHVAPPPPPAQGVGTPPPPIGCGGCATSPRDATAGGVLWIALAGILWLLVRRRRA